jgi:hypothetical protein
MKPLAYIAYADQLGKPTPLMVVIVRNGTLLAAGDPDTYASELASQMTDRFAAMSDSDREMALMDFNERQIGTATTVSRTETVAYSGKGKERVDQIMNGFLKSRSDRVLKKN